MWKPLLTALLLLGTSFASADVVDGYLSIRTRFFRLQSNANVNDNSGILRELVQVGFLQNEVIQTLKLKFSVGNQTQLLVENLVTYLSTVPMPRVALTKTSISIVPTNYSLKTKSFGVAYPLFYQTAVNSSTGDSLISAHLLTGSVLSWTSFKQTTSSENGVQIWNFNSCRTDLRDTCVSFRIANDSYSDAAQTYLPDAIKVSVELPVWQKQGLQNLQTHLLSALYFTDDKVSFNDFHGQVDQTVSDCSKRIGNANAFCSADIAVQFESDWSDSGYLNWARSATVTLGDGTNQSVSVSATTYTPAEVDAELNVSVSGFGSADSVISSLSGVEVVIYHFQLNEANATKLYWDPEVGMATIGTDNKVVGGVTVGALVGIVIGGVVVIGVIAGGIWYVRHRKAEHKYRFLG